MGLCSLDARWLRIRSLSFCLVAGKAPTPSSLVYYYSFRLLFSDLYSFGNNCDTRIFEIGII